MSIVQRAVTGALIAVDPAETVTNAMARILIDESLATELTRRGLELARVFSWNIWAGATWAISDEEGRR